MARRSWRWLVCGVFVGALWPTPPAGATATAPGLSLHGSGVSVGETQARLHELMTTCGCVNAGAFVIVGCDTPGTRVELVTVRGRVVAPDVPAFFPSGSYAGSRLCKRLRESFERGELLAFPDLRLRDIAEVRKAKP
jgi:hypothetical protein